MHDEALLYVLRPVTAAHHPGTALWLPIPILTAVGAKRGDTLTAKQYDNPLIQARLQKIRSIEKPSRSINE